MGVRRTVGAGVWGIREPVPERGRRSIPISCWCRSLPSIATGHRVGYGAGYYDMTITQLRARKAVIAVGLAFATQEVPAVPATPRDARLDLVLTEREVIDLRGR